MFGRGPDSTPGRPDEPDRPGDEGEGDDQRQRLVADPVRGQRGGHAGRQAGGHRRAVALLGDLPEVLEAGDAEDDDDEGQHADRPPEGGGDEDGGQHQSGSDRRRQVARRRARRRRRPRRSGRTTGALLGRTTARLRAHRRPPGHAGGIGADGDPAGLAARRRCGELAGRGSAERLGDAVRPHLAGRVAVDTTARIVERVFGDVVAPDRRLGGERRPHVDVVVVLAVGGRLWWGHAGDLTGRRIGPVGQRAGVVGAEAQTALAGVVGAIGGLVGEERTAELLGRVGLLLPFAPQFVAHLVILVVVGTSGRPASRRGQTSSSSVSLRPSAASIASTWSWVIFSSSFSAAFQLVGGDLPVALRSLQVLAGVAAQVAHRDPALLGHVLDDLDVLPPALLGERREREPDDGAVVARVDPEVGVPDGLLDRRQRAAVVRAHQQLPGLRDLDAGELLQGHLACRSTRWSASRSAPARRARSGRFGTGTARARPPCPSCRWLRATSLRSPRQRNRGEPLPPDMVPAPAARRYRTIVPTFSPSRMARRLPGVDMSNTTIGILLSRQKAMAVASITRRSRFMTSM